MPTSYYHQIPTIVSALIALNPKALLDVGFGFGTYGFLAREYLELWGETAAYGSFATRRIDGIEVFPTYVTALQKAVYSNIYIGDALTVLPTLTTRYDCAVAIDVIEHFTQEDGERFLALLRERADGVLISTPKYPDMEQHASFGNVHETHLSRWTPKMFAKWPTAVIPDANSWLVYLGTPERVRFLQRRLAQERWQQRIHRFAPWTVAVRRAVGRKLRQYRII